MDPNQWRNYNQAYGMSHGSGLSSTPANLNRFDLPLLNADQAALGLGLGPPLQSHTAARSVGGLPAVPTSYPHPLHNSMSQFLEAVSPLQSAFPAQNPYKALSVAPSSFGLDAQSLRSPEQTTVYGFPTTGDSRSTKPLLHDSHITKEAVANFAQNSQASSLSSSDKSVKNQSGWNLSNFVQGSASIFGSIGGELPSPTDLPGPPPAHSGKSSSSLSLQRNPLPSDLYATTQTHKIPRSYLEKQDELLLASQAVQQSMRSDILFQATGHGIEDLTKTSHSSSVYSNFGGTVSKSESSGGYTQQLSTDMNYDPVSPVASDAGQNNETFDTVNLQDLNTLSHSTLQKHERSLVADNSHLLSSHKNIPHEQGNTCTPNSQGMHSAHTPNTLQHGSLSGSPHLPISNSQTHMSSSNIVQAPPPIQAVADSTTKPKRGRGRKKKDANLVLDNKDNKNMSKFSDTLQSHQMGSNNPSLTASSQQSPVNMMNMNNQAGYNSYSPQKHPPYSPLDAQQQYSPKKNQSGSPQAYSPQVAAQTMVDKERFSMQPPTQRVPSSLSHPNVLSSNSAGMTTASSHMNLNSDSVIRSGQGSVIHNIQGVGHSHSPVTPSPPEQHHQRISHPMTDNISMSNNQLAEVMVGNGHSYNYNHVNNQSFVDQLQSDTGVDHLNKSPMDNQMTLPQLDLPDQSAHFVTTQHNNVYMPQPQTTSYVSPSQENIYTDLDSYNAQYESNHPQNNLASPQIGYDQSPVQNTSTIDEAALSSLIGNPSLRDTSTDDWHQVNNKVEQKPPHSITSNVEVDDEFQHLVKPPKCVDTKKPKPVLSINNINNHQSSQNQITKVVTPNQPCAIPTPPVVPTGNAASKKKNPNGSFLDSFLSFIQGKKPETLSSVNSSTVKRPELPKYIPEPRRPRPVEVTENKTSDNSPSDSKSSRVEFSDDEDNTGNVGNTVQSVLTRLEENDGEKRESLKMRISLKGNKRRISSSHVKPNKGCKKSKNKSRSHSIEHYASSGEDEYKVITSEEEEAQPVVVNKEPEVQPRKMSSRRAKEQGQEKRKKYAESDDSDGSIPDPIVKPAVDHEDDYDSDVDPAWTPFSAETKKPAETYDSTSFYGVRRKKKPKIKSGRSKSGRRQSSGEYVVEMTSPPITEPKIAEPKIKPSSEFKVVNLMEDRVPKAKTDSNSSSAAVDQTPGAKQGTVAKEGYNVGDYIIEKKDLSRYENFPIWKIEAGRMIRKFEVYTEKGKMQHKSICTFSSWMPSMQNDYIPIRVKHIEWHRDKEVVEVFEDDRPKPKLDKHLEHQYEDDPLADLFNVYLQIFLSQALEPGFLSAISEGVGETEFYRGPLENIDKLIEEKLEEMEEKVHWKEIFKRSLQAKPHLRELDRPNLRQACQACEDASQPAIKSIHLFGQSYDQFTLMEYPAGTALDGGSVEFMIGKTAANYVGPYHNLYHFKFNLYKRCLAKVDIVKQSDNELDNAEVLDRCLNNRTWVLKIFDDLKKMLDKG